MKKLLKNKKGMNAVETAILVIILLMLIIMYIDVLMVSQKMSAATAVSNYMARTIERQGGILNYVPKNFATYGHGSYTTSQNAYELICKNLEKTFGEDCIVDPNDPTTADRPVEIKVKLVQRDPDSVKETNHGVEILDFHRDSCFGIYLGGDGVFDEDSPGFISTRSLKYYKPYYIVVVTMKYDLWIIPAVVSDKDWSVNGMLSSDSKRYDQTKSFARIVVPSYYIREEHYNSSNTNNDNFFVV